MEKNDPDDGKEYKIHAGKTGKELDLSLSNVLILIIFIKTQGLVSEIFDFVFHPNQFNMEL
jgi:hypothetical protein